MNVDYTKEFRKYKVFVVAVSFLMMVCNIYLVKTTYDSAEESRQTIFVADASNTLMVALANDIQVNRPNEAKAALSRLHYFLFNMTPTANHINYCIGRAQALGDRSIHQYIEKEKERGWYKSMVGGGISTEFMCDSITVSDSDRPEYRFKAVLYGKTSMIYPERIEFRQIITESYLLDDERTIDEPNGFRIYQWAVKDLRLIKVFNRITVEKGETTEE